MHGRKYSDAVIPPFGSLFASRSSYARSQKPGFGGLEERSVVYGGGGSSPVMGISVAAMIWAISGEGTRECLEKTSAMLSDYLFKVIFDVEPCKYQVFQVELLGNTRSGCQVILE